MSENPLRRADQIETASLLGSESHDDGGSIGQSDLRDDGRPARERGPLQMKEEEDTAKEAFDATAFAQFFFRLGGRQTGAVLLPFGVPWHDGDRPEHRVDPTDEPQSPIGSIQADDPGTDVVEVKCPFQQWACKGGIMDVGWRDEKMERQARATTEQGMHAIAAQERTGMLGWSMTKGRIGIGLVPSQNGSTIDNQIACTHEATFDDRLHTEHEEGLRQWGSCCPTAFTLLRATGNQRAPVVTHGQTTGQGQGWPSHQPVMHILIGEPPQGAQERYEEQRLLTVAAGTASWASGQGGWTTPVDQLDSEAAQDQQMQ